LRAIGRVNFSCIIVCALIFHNSGSLVRMSRSNEGFKTKFDSGNNAHPAV